MDIFTYFPKVTYENKESRNIIAKLGLVRDIINKYKVFYPYSVKDGERPDTIAYDYYGESSYEWLVCYPNNIMDIHSDWVKSYREFYRYMERNYGNINDTKNQIHHYKYTGITGDSKEEIARKNWKMSEATFNNTSEDDRAGWTPVYLFDYEMELNEDKRNIVLLSNEYLAQINKEIRELL
jgi:hypothetical protein